MLVGAVSAIDDWAGEHAASGQADVPGGIGQQQTRFRDVPVAPFVRSYTLWMVQRALDAYGALSSRDRDAVDAALTGSGWEPLLALEPRHRLVKRGYQLAWEA
jgi:hypothetical protein